MTQEISVSSSNAHQNKQKLKTESKTSDAVFPTAHKSLLIR